MDYAIGGIIGFVAGAALVVRLGHPILLVVERIEVKAKNIEAALGLLLKKF